MLLDGKVSHVAANIVTVVSVRIHTSSIIVAVQVAISITVHIRIAFVLRTARLRIVISHYSRIYLSLLSQFGDRIAKRGRETSLCDRRCVKRA